jgi:uncharacterized protein (TIGR03382 family)
MSTRWIGLLLFVLWVGRSGVAHAAPQIAVTPDSPPDVELGSARFNDAAATPTRTRNFQISNTGNMMLMVTGITFTNGDYQLNPTPSFPLTITNGSPATITVEFNPSATGTLDATMTIANNSMNDSSKDVDLTGTGTAAVISVTDTINFEVVPIGTPSSRNLSIMNTVTTSQGPLTVASATITGSTFFRFSNTLGCNNGTTCTFNPPLVITNGTSTVPIVCDPPAAASGTSTGTVTFTSDSDPGGDGTTTVQCTAGRPNIVVSASSLNFINLAVGQEQTQPVTITNNGTTALTYSVAENPDVAQFTFPDSCTSGCTIQPPPAQNTATLNVRFTPNSPVQVTTRIDITNDDPDPGDNVKSINVSGTGDQGVIATIPASPTPLNFGGVAQGSSKPLPFTLRNSGNVTITGISGTLNNTNLGFQFDTGTLPASLTAGQQVTLNVIFAPPVGNIGGSTSITFNASWTADGRSDTTTATLQLTGVGQTTGYDVAPATLAFGDFRFDDRPTLDYQITNTAQAPLTVLSAIDFTPDAPTAAGEFAFAATKNGAPIELTPPPVLLAGEHLDVRITAQPNSRIGALSGRVTVRTNLMPDRQVILSGNAITAGISVPPTVDFGAVDIDGTAPSQTIKLTNTGAATLDIMSITARDGSTAFTVMPLPTTKTTVAPGADFTLNVTYTPLTARPANQPEVLVLDAALAGIIGGPPQATITLQGRGIDRNLTVDALTPFPDTFRNPGDAAPVRAVTVTNTGEATLKVTQLMISDEQASAGEPVWQLVDSSPVDIAGNSSHDFLVRFSPKQIDDTTHTTPDGRLVLVNNDSARQMVTVELRGKCIDRSVGFGPPDRQFNVGQIGVGIPTIVELPAIENLDRVGFTIRSIELAGNQVFQLDSAPRDVELPVSGSERLTLTLEPTATGTVTTTVKLFLDQDPEPHRELTVTATAVFVEAHGGGGCSAGGANAGGGAAIALGALAAFGAIGRRRRRRAAKPRVAGSVTGIVAIAALAAPARADDVGVSVFAPTPATTGTGFQLQAPDVGLDGNWAASSVVSYASDSVVLDGLGPNGPFHAAPVERSTLVQLGFAYALLGRFEVGVHMPLYMQSGQSNDSGSARLEPASGTALGNLSLHGKARLWRGSTGLGELVAGASAIAIIPTASSGQFTGSDNLEARALLLGSLVPSALGSRLTVSVNAGAILRGEATYASVTERSGIAWGLGASYRVLDSLWATAELFGEATPSGRRTDAAANESQMTGMLMQGEWLAGLCFKADRRFTVGVAVGRGVTDAVGTPALRGVASIAFTPGAPSIAPLPVEVPRPDGDGDGDGIADSADRCPDEAEDKDLFDDSDGCPDVDNDRDGMPDAQDRCPIDAEDKDGFQDVDGCPEKDNDGDGIPDAQDRCATEPEDKDGFEDLDGCPDPDNDRDGIADAADKCAAEPETINGIKDDDGCPDRGDSTIVLSPDRIETLDPITFNGLKLPRASLPLLGQVAATLRAHTEIVRVRITVHVHPSGDTDADQARSEKRAQVVRDWLVQWGIAPARLDARGFGSSKPLRPANQRGAARINERIEFIILERK